jgi:glycosyltransferase involved in cell wall biosynthesis
MPMPIGYFVPEFPSQTHAFFWREIGAMEAAGAELALYSTRRPDPGACPHAFADAARARTRYVFPPRAGTGLLAGRPARLARAAGYLAGLSETPRRGRAALLPLVAAAADLAADCRRRGIGHVHVHSFANSAHVAALAHILDGLSYSLTLHGDLPVYGRDHAAKCARAAFCVGVTAPLLEQIRGVYDGPVHLIPMGVDVERFRPPDPPRRRDGPLVVLTVARLNRTKGHRYFLQAMARVTGQGHDIRYRIAGDGPHRETLRAEIRDAGLEDRVELLGQVGEDRVLDLLREADLFALTSFGRGEAAPVSVMEAMACGLPVICSAIGGTPAMIEDGRDGFLVPQQDVDAIAAALGRLAAEPDLAAAMAAAARASAVAKFSHTASAARLLDVIRSTGG